LSLHVRVCREVSVLCVGVQLM